MPRISITADEVYPFLDFDLTSNKHGYEVNDLTLQRWERVMKELREVQEELASLYYQKSR